MKAPLRNFIIRGPTGIREAETLVLGVGAAVRDTAGGLPELVGTRVGETQLLPSGGDDTAAIAAALISGNQVRLGPGTFLVSATLIVAGGSISGCGTGLTTIQSSHAGTVLSIGTGGSQNPGVEQLTIRGPGESVIGSRGILSGGSGVFVRNIRVEAVRTGITLASAYSVVDNVFIGAVGTGLQVQGSGSVVSDVSVQGASSTALSVTAEACALRAIRIEGCLAAGISIGGKSNSLAGARVISCGNSITITGQGVTVDATTVQGCTRGILVSAAQRVVLDAVSVLNTPNPLAITNSQAVTATSFHSDLRQTSVDAPHVAVSASPLVTLVSFLRINPTAVVLTFEADVAAAGSRVVFIQHNLDVTKVNSGGNFAAL
ncbi:MAG TPA: hypothetical protein VGB66_17120 [Longimicrobium sp.]|jgi:hypothetical protein